ncbi:MAG: hypothetical protein ISF22_00205 [Methanomassiliicoccus sp.]|nr:hypothetical protein [Methanomassiliicoccus sp.]
MGKKMLAGVLAVTAMLITVAFVSPWLTGGVDLSPAHDGSGDDLVADTDKKASSTGTIRQEMSFRSDLSGDRIRVNVPFFLDLRETVAPGSSAPINATGLLEIVGARSSEVDVRTYQGDRPTSKWTPFDADGGVRGYLPHDGSIYFDITNTTATSTLIMVVIATPGNYSISVNTTDARSGQGLAPPVSMEVAVEATATPYLFGAPRVVDEYGNEWMILMTNGSSMFFELTAPTTGMWAQTDQPHYRTYYNWTVTVINPEGMSSDDDLARYNTGDPTIDQSGLLNTSIDSAWYGMGSSSNHVVWDRTIGVRLSGSNASTPTAKEFAYGGATWMEWNDGTWQPRGSGETTFHQTGHFIFLITLTKNGQAVSAPLILETIVT